MIESEYQEEGLEGEGTREGERARWIESACERGMVCGLEECEIE